MILAQQKIKRQDAWEEEIKINLPLINYNPIPKINSTLPNYHKN
jgi:hypothetical protein